MYVFPHIRYDSSFAELLKLLGANNSSLYVRSLDQKGLGRKGTYHHMQESFMCMFGKTFGYFSIIERILFAIYLYALKITTWLGDEGGHAAGVK